MPICARVRRTPTELFIHPECGCASAALSSVPAWCRPNARILSTSGMVAAAREVTAERCSWPPRPACRTSSNKAQPLVLFRPVKPCGSLQYMKMITPAKLLRSRDGTDEVTDAA